MALQADYLSLTARTLVPLLQNLSSPEGRTEQAIGYLRKWDFRLDPSSVAASIYVAWEGQLKASMGRQTIPANARPYLTSLPTKRVIDWLVTPGLMPTGTITGDPIAYRDSLLLTCLDNAVAELTDRLGSDMDEWQYGQRKNKHITITHPLSDMVDKAMREKINLGPGDMVCFLHSNSY